MLERQQEELKNLKKETDEQASSPRGRPSQFTDFMLKVENKSVFKNKVGWREVDSLSPLTLHLFHHLYSTFVGVESGKK